MKQTNHTPGPWKITLAGQQPYVSMYMPLGLPNETGWMKFAVQPYAGPRTEACIAAQSIANARLIAAAPDLLDACRQIVTTWEGGDLAAAARMCAAAISKAEG